MFAQQKQEYEISMLSNNNNFDEASFLYLKNDPEFNATILCVL
jgi:hypothetical protein